MQTAGEPQIKDRYFHFKRFSVRHDRSSMKVGTDAVLLGLLTSCHSQGDMLEVGCGCGVISLLIAERTVGNILAIDPDEQSLLDTEENFNNSIWSDRLAFKQTTLQQLASQSSRQFSLIFSNPPFFTNSLKGPNDKRNRARHTDTLPFDQFASASANLLKQDGRISVILPADQKAAFVCEMNKVGLGLIHCIEIIPIEGRKPVRIILEFCRNNLKTEYKQLILRTAQGTTSEQYQKLAEGWYLRMK